MIRSVGAAILAGALAAAAGCSVLDIAPEGSFEGAPVEVRKGGPHVLIDGSGAVLMGESEKKDEMVPLRLPTAAEHERFGVTVVDASAIPPLWRRPHQAEGGVMVTALRKASPLAVAGLRLADVVRSVNGKPVADPPALLRELRAAPEGKPLRLEVTRASGDLEVAARARGRLDDETNVYVPLLFQRKSGPLGHTLGLGPLDAVFSHWSAVREPDWRKFHYRRDTLWWAFAGLVIYSRETNLDTHESEGRLRLLWGLIPIWSEEGDAS